MQQWTFAHRQSFLRSAQCVVVDQLEQLSPSVNTKERVASFPKSRILAIVDRTSDVNLAAKEVVASRLALGGKSSYAVDQVFVNEFIAETFIDAIAQELLKFEQVRLADSRLVTADKRATLSPKSESGQQIRRAQQETKSNRSRLIGSGQSALAVEVLTRYTYATHLR